MRPLVLQRVVGLEGLLPRGLDVSGETLGKMVIHFCTHPILLLASRVELQLREREIILDAVLARVWSYIRSALLPICLGLLKADLAGPVFVVVHVFSIVQKGSSSR